MLKIYLTDLVAYNKGFLIGEWISLPHEDIQSSIDKILSLGSKVCHKELGYYEEHEEWFITDYEWEDVEVFNIGEYEDIYRLNDELESIEHLEPDELKILKFLLSNNIANSVFTAIDKIDDVTIHKNCTMQDVAYELINECYNIDALPSIIANNIDYERAARDIEMDGRYYSLDYDIYEYVG